MRRLPRYAISGVMLLSLQLAWAQNPFALDSKPVSKNLNVVGGTSTVESIRMNGRSMSTPLRYPFVVKASEIIDLDGRLLTRDKDYAIDYQAGVIYFTRPVKAGQRVRAQYRFDPNGKPDPAGQKQSFAGITNPGGLGLSFARGTGVILGMGIAERSADGTVVNNNLYGLKNSFQFSSGGGLKGLFVVADRQKVQSESMYEPESEQKGKGDFEEGQSQALMQNLDANILGGKVQAWYQDIREKFSGFQAFRDAGYAEEQIQQLKKERGLKRIGIGFTDIGSKGLNFSHSYRSIRDDDGSIESRMFGANLGPIQLKWTGDRVAKDFKRFKDLAEPDREMLGKEAGMSRETLSGALNLSGAKGAFESKKIEAGDGSSIFRKSMSLDSARLKFSYSDQHVEKDFQRFGNLREADAGQLAREQGISRQSWGIQLLPFKNVGPWNYSTSVIRTETGDFRALDYSLGVPGLHFSYYSRRSDPGFGKLGSMSDPEIYANIQAIKQMYAPADFPTKPDEKNWFVGQPGLERKAYRLSVAPAKNWSLSGEQLQVKGQQAMAMVNTYQVGTPFLTFGYRSQSIDERFGELTKLMNFERQRLGDISGLDRVDAFGLLKLGKLGEFGFTSMKSESPAGGASRSTFAMKNSIIDLTYTRRSVDAEFDAVNRLVDPEKDLLTALKGYDQSALTGTIKLLSNLSVKLDWFDARSPLTDQEKVWRDTTLMYKPDKFTSIALYRHRQRDDSITSFLYGMDCDRYSLERSFGRLGKFSYMNERIFFDGDNSKQLLDATKKAWAYETKLNSKSDFRTEQLETKYEDGNAEVVKTHSLSSQLTKNLGVTLSETHVTRDGDKLDETKRNYGFWLDLGHGVRINYGHVRSLIENSNGEMKTEVGATPGELGPVKVENAGYRVQRWDNQRQQAVGNIRLSNAKPLRLGPVQDFQFLFSVDTVRDYEMWQRENREFMVGFKLLGTTLKYEHKSQFHPSGWRGVDRAFSLSTDQSDKNPIRASIYWKKRSQPWGEDYFIRNYSLAVRPFRGMEVRHQLVTNPEVFKGDAFLGSVPQADRSSKWSLSFDGGRNMTMALSWEELKNDATRRMSRTIGANLTLFPRNPSPVNLFYGLEMSDNGSGDRKAQHRYWLRFDQRPGPNQNLSLFLGNLNWQYARPDNQRVQNFTVRLDYQLKF